MNEEKISLNGDTKVSEVLRLLNENVFSKYSGEELITEDNEKLFKGKVEELFDGCEAEVYTNSIELRIEDSLYDLDFSRSGRIGIKPKIDGVKKFYVSTAAPLVDCKIKDLGFTQLYRFILYEKNYNNYYCDETSK